MDLQDLIDAQSDITTYGDIIITGGVAGLSRYTQFMAPKSEVRGPYEGMYTSGDIELAAYAKNMQIQAAPKLKLLKGGNFYGQTIVEIEKRQADFTGIGKKSPIRVDEFTMDYPFKSELSLFIMRALSRGLIKGMFSAQRVDGSNTTAELFNGIDKINAAQVTAGEVSVAKKNLYALGTLTNANTYDKLFEFYDTRTEDMKDNEELILWVSPKVKDFNNKAFLSQFGAVVYNDRYNQDFLTGTRNPVRIVSHPGIGSNIYLTTPRVFSPLFDLSFPENSDQTEFCRFNQPDNLNVFHIWVSLWFGMAINTVDSSVYSTATFSV